MTPRRRRTPAVGHRLPIVVLVIAAATIAVFALPGTADAQCAMCRTMLATPEGQKMVGALRSGILLLLAAPFAIFATIATLAVRAQRRRQAPADGSPVS